MIRIRDANNKRLNIEGTVELSVQIGNHREQVTFYVAERLATDFILGCDFCDKHVEAIRPRKKLLELNDGTTVPIIRKNKCRRKQIPLPDSASTVPKTSASSSKIVLAEDVTLPLNSQNWVQMKTAQHGLIHVQPIDKLYSSRLCLAGNGIAQVESGKNFGIFLANFGDQPQIIKAGTKIVVAKPHPKWIKESSYSHSDILGIVEEGPDNSYKKRQMDAKNLDTINQYLTKLQKSQEESTENKMKVEDINLDEIPEEYHEQIRNMLKKHESMWLGGLGEISVIEHTIEFTPEARPFKSPPYRASPKARELEGKELDNQKDLGVIEPSQSEWGAPVLLFPKKCGKLRFCVDYRRLNTMTIKDSYPLPRIDDCIDSHGDAIIFSTLDANSGYWQMKIRKQDRHKTAFVTHNGVFQYVRMPFGLTNAPACLSTELSI